MPVIILVTLGLLFVAVYVFQTAQAVLTKRYAEAADKLWKICSIDGNAIFTFDHSRLCALLAGTGASSKAVQRLRDGTSVGSYKYRAYQYARKGEWDAARAEMHRCEPLILQILKGNEMPPAVRAEFDDILDVISRQDTGNLYQEFQLEKDIAELMGAAKLARVASILIALAAIGLAYIGIAALHAQSPMD